MERGFAALGLGLWIAIAWAFSTHRRKVDWPLVAKGLLLQLILVLLVLGLPVFGIRGPLQFLFDGFNQAVTALLNYTLEGSKFLFGDLLNSEKYGFIFAYQVLPTIIFVSALMSLLYQLGIMQKIVGFFAWIFFRVMRTSGAETLAASANIFVGQTEAPLVIKPYLNKMTRSELLCLMVGGMANVAGGVLAAYVALLRDRIPDIAGHLLTASVLSAPASLLLSKILLPEVETPVTLGKIPEEYKQKPYTNAIEAVTEGAAEGLKLALNVGAQLLAFIALIAMVNGLMGLIGTWIQVDDLSLQKIMSWVFSPLMIFLGIPVSEISIAGQLVGEKTILNEFVAYLSLTEQAPQLSDRTVLIMSYALCGFANFSSIAIQVGGIGAMAPDRKKDLSELGMQALIGGTLSSFMTASFAALVIV
ncbi:MAG: NupC/NupG family nucleoside CNT transporter [Bdellovibrionales bacterium]